ncbi:MAG: oligosaccharide flippase family protein [Anaerolineae bacterium]|nr:oligosaccharide flippase family protein [Anaerolineae bacterium]
MQRFILSSWTTLFNQVVTHVRVPLHRNAYLLAFSTAATAGLGALYWVLAARRYPAAEVGLHSAVVATVMFLSGLAQFDLVNVLNRFVPSVGRAVGRLVKYSYLLTLVASAAAALIFAVGEPIWTPERSILETNAPYLTWFAFAVMAWSIFSLQDSVLIGLRSTTWVPIENIVTSGLRVVMLVLFATLIPQYGILASWSIPLFLAIIPINYLIFRRLIPAHVISQKKSSADLPVRPIATFAASNYVGTLFFLISTLLLPLIVVSRAGAEANAYFYMVWVLRGSLDLIPMNMALSLTTEGAIDQAKMPQFMRQMWTQMLRLMLPVVLIIFIGAEPILAIFGASYSAAGATLLRLVALTVFPKTIIILFLSAARVFHQSKRIIAIQGWLSVLILGLSFPLLDWLGITGVGIAWLISHTLVAAVLLVMQLRVRAKQSATQGTRFVP